MAIKNASDLLVNVRTSGPATQVTRIYVKSSNPISLPDGSSTGTLKMNNITNTNGQVYYNRETAAASNTGTDVLAKIGTLLANMGIAGNVATQSTTIDGVAWKYRDFVSMHENSSIPTYEVANGTATMNDGAFIVEVRTTGSGSIFDPIAFSTSASISVNRDLRDITNKDSEGWSESLPGLKSFEISTDSLQSVNPDTPLDGSDFFDMLKEGELVSLSFTDRVINLVDTNLTQAGVDGFLMSSGMLQTNGQPDALGGTTGAKLQVNGTQTFEYLGWGIDSDRIQGKKFNWSFYVKAVDANNNKLSLTLSDSTAANTATVTKLEGDGTIAKVSPTSQYWNVTGLSTSSWTRISVQTNNINIDGGAALRFYIYPGVYNSQSSDQIFTSSWQVEISDKTTSYKDPNEVTYWQGNALVSSVNFDSGVEDNYVCSATFTGDGHLYPNGLGPELIADTGFDDSGYWTVEGASVVQNGYGKILYTAGGAESSITKSGLMTSTNYYLLTYTVSSSPTPEGGIIVTNGWDGDPSDAQVSIPINQGTHKVLLKAGQSDFQLKKNLTTEDTTVWISSISLKQVL